LSRYPVHTAALAVFGFLVQDGIVVSHTTSRGPFVVLLQGMRRSVGRSGAANAEGLQGLLVPSEQALKQPPWRLAELLRSSAELLRSSAELLSD
jgi:hypothetical protein